MNDEECCSDLLALRNMVTVIVPFILLVTILYRCCCCGFAQVSLFNIGGNNVQVVKASSIFSDSWSGAAVKLRVIAEDKEGNQLANYRLGRQAPTLKLRIEGDAQCIKASQGNIHIQQCGNIRLAKASQGSMKIGRCGDMGHVEASQGSITIDSCASAYSTRAHQGNGNVRSRSRTRQ